MAGHKECELLNPVLLEDMEKMAQLFSSEPTSFISYVCVVPYKIQDTNFYYYRPTIST